MLEFYYAIGFLLLAGLNLLKTEFYLPLTADLDLLPNRCDIEEKTPRTANLFDDLVSNWC